MPPPDVEQRVEGPFGEFTGYYAGGEKLRPVMRVQAVYHRTKPILHGDPPLRPPLGHWGCPPASSLLRVWDGLERGGHSGHQGRLCAAHGRRADDGRRHQAAVRGPRAPGGARGLGPGAHLLQMVIVVDDDIDPSNSEEVLWAIATR